MAPAAIRALCSPRLHGAENDSLAGHLSSTQPYFIRVLLDKLANITFSLTSQSKSTIEYLSRKEVCNAPSLQCLAVSVQPDCFGHI